MSGFIAMNRTPETAALRKMKPKAFLLLSLIAERARWMAEPCKITGLKQGQAMIGDFPEAGLRTRAEYRAALSYLEKKAELVTVETTTKGTIVTLIDSRVFSIAVDSTTTKTTSGRPSNNHPATTKNKGTKKPRNKREREAPSPPSSSLFFSEVGRAVIRELRNVFPNAEQDLSKDEGALLESLAPKLKGLPADDWLALRCWFVEADDEARGKKLWPKSRLHFFELYGDSMEKIRTWWLESGSHWWERKQRAKARAAEKQRNEPKEVHERIADKEGAADIGDFIANGCKLERHTIAS